MTWMTENLHRQIKSQTLFFIFIFYISFRTDRPLPQLLTTVLALTLHLRPQTNCKVRCDADGEMQGDGDANRFSEISFMEVMWDTQSSQSSAMAMLGLDFKVLLLWSIFFFDSELNDWSFIDPLSWVLGCRCILEVKSCVKLEVSWFSYFLSGFGHHLFLVSCI